MVASLDNFTRTTVSPKKNCEVARYISQVTTSLPMIAMEGTAKSHGPSMSSEVSNGLVHSKTSVAATISCSRE
jgi:hypothetical protein